MAGETMRRQGRGTFPRDESVARLLRLKRTVQNWAFGFITVFILMSFFVPPDVGRRALPLVLLALSVFTIFSGFVAYRAGLTGLSLFDNRPSVAKATGIVWMFAGCFLAIFGLSYFFA